MRAEVGEGAAAEAAAAAGAAATPAVAGSAACAACGGPKMQMASSAPAYVTELVRGSGSLQAINDEFRQFSQDVEIWSFYETQKLSAKGFSTLIVDPESATLGYRDERQIPMNADHRSICKFQTPQDQNYIIIRNSLVLSMTGLSRSGKPIP